MLAVAADGNRKLYRFRRDTRWSFDSVFIDLFIYLIHFIGCISSFSFFLSSDDPDFFEGLFVAEDVAVSRFVETIQKAVRNASFNHNLTEKLSQKEPYMSDLDFLPTSTTSTNQLLQNQTERINAIYCMTALLSFDLLCLLCVS